MRKNERKLGAVLTQKTDHLNEEGDKERFIF